MKALLLNDTTAWYHYGCTATSSALKEAIKSHIIITSLTTLSILETYKVKSTPDNYADFLRLDNYHKFTKDNKFLVKLLEENDLIIINGEGTIHDNRKAAIILLYIAYVAKINLHKHVEILNHSVYPKDNLSIDNKLLILTENDHDTLSIYALVYRAIDFFAIREPISTKIILEITRKNFVNAEINLQVAAFDCMPIYIKNHYIRLKINKQYSKKLLVAGSAAWAVNINNLAEEIGENVEQLTISDSRGNYKNFTKIMENFIIYLKDMAEDGFEITFLIGGNTDIPHIAKDDQIFKQYLENKLSDLIKLEKFKVYCAQSLDDWLHCIEESSLLISGRFHHSIAAACLGTSFIAFNSNTPKVEGLCMLLDVIDNFINYHDPKLLTKLYDRTKVLLNNPLILEPKNTTQKLADLAMKNFRNLKKL